MAVTGTVGELASDLSPALPGLLADRAPRVVVVGDAVLDEWLTGRTRRISREAPVPVVDVAEVRRDAGGAAHTAVSLAALGARVTLVSLVGDDAEGAALRALLDEAGVDTSGTVTASGVRTATKRRVLAEGSVVARFDTTDADRGAAHRPALTEAAEAALGGHPDAVVVCDHGHGPALAAREGLRAGRAGTGLLVVDAHELARWADLAPDLVVPNLAEAEGLLGRTLRTPSEPADGVVEAVQRCAGALRDAAGAAAVAVTLDRDGAVLVPDAGPVHRTWARPAPELRACGAGDTVTATLAMALAAAVPERTALELAQVAADVVVARDGTTACTTADLVAALSASRTAVLGRDEITRVAGRVRDGGGRLVFTNGCFDVLHAGHVMSLNQAKRLGDVLVVGVNDDGSVTRRKGPGRPINTAADRAAVLAALSCVDYVTTFAEDTPAELMRAVRPDVYAKGGDYTEEMLPESEVLRAWGGRVVLLDYLAERSTSAIVERARRSEPSG